ncbi:MAG: Mannose-6-phosphate isomerase/mannose-1-phosphate guanylyl transferase [Parcubacteria group bacterium GW2011_GWA2_47_7]|nr:MAG: Mannose-6-phosphate isomerase/mannose-1-phosphate guanylyl transferase [Parcubacteria group bacterium GW2011_GWA2_47_7]
MSKKKVVAVSGGFDPVHIGHIRMFEEARKLGNELVIILNNDNWLIAKKGFVFMPEDERAEVLRSLRVVDRVVITKHESNDSDRSVMKALVEVNPDIFANGGDRKNENDIPEAVICKKLGIEMDFNVGHGGKVQSSSWLTESVRNHREERPWGSFENHAHRDGWHLKVITVHDGKRTSLQHHKHRKETWVVVEGVIAATVGDKEVILPVGGIIVVEPEARHRIHAVSGHAKLVEVSLGFFDEDDIIRHEDDYGRTNK